MIDPDPTVEAFVDAREPKIAEEVRSFLGLVNCTERFVPDLATVSALVHQLCVGSGTARIV